MKYLTEAIASCEKALKTETDNINEWQIAFRKIGNILQGMGRFEEGMTWHSRAVEPEPELPEVYIDLGILYTNQEEWDKAIALINEAIEIKPDYLQAYLCLAQIYGNLRQKEREVEVWYRLFQIKGDEISAEGYYQVGKALQQQGKLKQAIQCYQRSIKQDQKFWLSYQKLGEICLSSGDWEKASKCYLQVLKQDENQAWAHHELGVVWLKQDRFDEAIAASREAIRLNPDSPWPYNNIVQAFLRQKKWDETIATCRAIIALVDEYPWVYSQLGNSLAKKGELEEAIFCFQKASRLRGWADCLEKRYQFTSDNFGNTIPMLEEHLQPLAHQDEIRALEIGSFQGMSACWLLDRILTASSARLTCIDSQFPQEFEVNLLKTGAAEKVTRLQGDTHKLILSLADDTYNFINVQDRCRKTDYIEETARLCWKHLELGGIMLFKDYGWRNPKNPAEYPKMGINAFLDSIRGNYEILVQSYQLMIKKIGG